MTIISPKLVPETVRISLKANTEAFTKSEEQIIFSTLESFIGGDLELGTDYTVELSASGRRQARQDDFCSSRCAKLDPALIESCLEHCADLMKSTLVPTIPEFTLPVKFTGTVFSSPCTQACLAGVDSDKLDEDVLSCLKDCLADASFVTAVPTSNSCKDKCKGMDVPDDCLRSCEGVGSTINPCAALCKEFDDPRDCLKTCASVGPTGSAFASTVTIPCAKGCLEFDEPELCLAKCASEGTSPSVPPKVTPPLATTTGIPN